MVSTYSYHHAKFEEDRTPSVGAKICCLYVFFCLLLSCCKAGTLFIPAGILRAGFVSLFIDAVFSIFYLSYGLDKKLHQIAMKKL